MFMHIAFILIKALPYLLPIVSVLLITMSETSYFPEIYF